MKKVKILIVLFLTAQMSFAQTALEMVKEQQCATFDQRLKSLVKNSVHPKRSLKVQTWVRLAEGYAQHTTECGRDSTSATKAWNAINKAKEMDTENEFIAEIDTFLYARPTSLMYSAALNQGVVYYNSGNLQAAIDLFKIGSIVDETDTLSTFYSGYLSNELGNTEDAIAAYTQYIDKANGRDPSAYYTLSNIAKSNDDIETAISWLKRGVAETGSKDIQGDLINTYISNDMLGDAILDLEALVAADPSHITNTLNLGILYDNQGESVQTGGNEDEAKEWKSKALVIYAKVLEMDADNFDCNFNLGVYYFNEAVNIKKVVDAMDIKTYQEKGKEIEIQACAKFNEAKPYFDECERINPGDEEVTRNLSNLTNVLAQCK